MADKKHARLKELNSPDLPDMEHAVPKDSASFRILVQALIGLEEGDAADTFNFIVCTPDWLKQNLHAGEALSGRYYIIIAAYDYHTIRREIEKYCRESSAGSWEEIAVKLHSYGRWEYAK